MKDLQQLKPKKILVRMPNWIGDLIMATPILTDLKKRFPEAEITALCKKPISDLLKYDQDIDELFCIEKSSTNLRRNERKGLVEKLRRGNYDLGILLTNSFSSAWLLWQGRVKNRIGFKKDFRGFLLTVGLNYPEDENLHQVEAYKQLLAPLGISPSNTLPRIYLKDEELQQGKDILKKYGIQSDKIIVGINPGAAYGSAKCWLPERFKELTRHLLQNENIHIIYFGDLLTEPLVKGICKDFPTNRVTNLAALTTLREFAALIKLSDVFLTNDSGPMHMAAALKTPLVALFGSTSDVKTGPYKFGTVIHKHVECSPCYQRTCPIDFRCMKQIEVEEVLQELSKYLHS